MDKKHYLEAGKIINTFGVHGEIKVDPWTDDPSFLLDFSTLYIENRAVKVTSSRVHKSFLLISLDGVDNLTDALKLKNKIIYISRNDIKLEAGRFFIADLIGLAAINNDTGEEIGYITDVLILPANNVYVIKAIQNTLNEILIPAVDEFVIEINLSSGYIKFKMIDGM